MGLLELVKGWLMPPLVDPNPVIDGVRGRGRIVDVGPYAVGGDTATTARWSRQDLTIVAHGADESQRTRVTAHLSERAHLRAWVGVDVPVVLDPAGRILGVDIAAWEAEVVELDARDAPIGGA